MIKFQHVSKAYRGGRQALQKVDFHLRRGEMAFLGGHSGAGKSTLLKLICAIERPTDGQIWFNGHDITRIPNKDIPLLRRNIGIVFQDHRLLMDRTVYDNVALPMRIESIAENEIKRRVSAALDKTELLDKARCLPSQLSGGEQQRVGIARAVVNRPTLLLADEPTGNLDPELSNRVLRLFEEFNRAGVTILLATHDIGLVNTRPQYRHLELNQGFLSEVEDYGR
ncbi:cell division ATP-binding protein FtsE [Vibrio sp.]|uniref:cell division ATP-binding protein FtsE n=1 Tax=Vibrio sp. TaxID=678 RepID=UPI003D10B873